MHDKQYREYKSGLAKEQFNKDLAERMAKAGKTMPQPQPAANAQQPTADNDLAAVAMALHMASKPATRPAATLPVIRPTQWKRHF